MQSTISQYGAPAFKGMLDGIGPRNVRSYAAEEIIPIAYPVKLGTSPEKEVLKATAGAGAIGFALHDYAREQTSAGVVQYANFTGVWDILLSIPDLESARPVIEALRVMKTAVSVQRTEADGAWAGKSVLLLN